LNRTKWLALIAGAILVLAGGRMGLRYLDWHLSEAARTEVAQLQTLATSACRCTREQGKTAQTACWQEYNAAIADREVHKSDTMCFPVSTSMDCVSIYGYEECIVTSYGNDICTKEEAQAAEAAYSAAWNAEGDPDNLDEAARQCANLRANAALEAVLNRIKRGEAIVASVSSGGCAG
jgi:hypothetical protein